jgi:hypothetical protein
MTRHDAAWWTIRVDELRRGGDARAIALRDGVNWRTLLWWRTQLGKKARETAGRGPRLLPVIVRDAPRTPPVGRGAELDVLVEIGGTRMTLRGTVTAEHLAAIVSASARAC